MHRMNRPIAFYLPQFHPIPENDEWWGRGFTEWTNVTKAKPLFKGHYQPHLPADLGFYDLRLPEVREQQAQLAKDYGIYGFCYYHYWFNGKRLLERPAEEVLQSGKPDFPFMLCWANENWSRRWDGSEHVVLMKQEYSEADAQAHSRSLIPYFTDKRYITIDNKPVFAIYRPQLIPQLPGYINAFREEAQKAGVELYLLCVEAFDPLEPSVLNCFDAVIEFQPQSLMLTQFIKEQLQKKVYKHLPARAYNKILRTLGMKEQLEDYMFRVQYNLDYNEYVDYLLDNYQYPTSYKRFPGVNPMWDNTARRGKNAMFFYNSNPEKYAEWLQYHMENFTPYSKWENLLFINAWNEWAEGNHLEPCQRWGKAYLEATKEALSNKKLSALAS
jgi:lipopolysaccharide biosynthesis protein